MLSLTVVRQGAPLKISVPVSAAHPMLIAGLQGNYPSYFIFGPMVFSCATTEFMTVPNSNPAILGGMKFAGNPLATRRGDAPDSEREELVVIAAPFFPAQADNRQAAAVSSVVDSVNGRARAQPGASGGLLRDQESMNC